MAGLISLSNATRLKDLTFVCGLDPPAQFVVATLRTITSNHQNLQLISINASTILYRIIHKHPSPLEFRDTIGEAAYTGWLELDRLLIKLWESHSVHVKVLCIVRSPMCIEGARGCMESLFPEVMKNRAAELIIRK